MTIFWTPKLFFGILFLHSRIYFLKLSDSENARQVRCATIVFGHHSHVVAGVERWGNGLIFCGLGNFLHAGLQNMARYDECRDFGLYARVYLWAETGKDPELRAVEVTPLKDMHEVPGPLPAGEASRRIEILNALSAELGSDGGQPLQFAATDSGSGLACIQARARYGDGLEARCHEIESRPVEIGS